MTRRPATKQQGDRVFAAAFLAPFMIPLLVFQYVMLLAMVRNSAYDYSLLNLAAGKFVGLRNFTGIVEYQDTSVSFSVTFLFALGIVFTVIPLAFSLAPFLNAGLPAHGLVRTIIRLPVVTSVEVAIMWSFLLEESNGLINGGLNLIDIRN